MESLTYVSKFVLIILQVYLWGVHLGGNYIRGCCFNVMCHNLLYLKNAKVDLQVTKIT